MRHCGMPQTFEDAVNAHYIVERWGNFIQAYPWQWYCHLTFVGELSDGTAHKQFGRWINNVNRRAFGRRYSRDPNKGVTWIRGTELQQRDVVHYHVVVGNHTLPPELGKQLWPGDARVVAYDLNRGGAFYMAKRCFVHGMDVSNNLAANRPH